LAKIKSLMGSYATGVDELAKTQLTLLAQIDKRSAISNEWTRQIDAELASPALAKLDNRAELQKLLHQADAKVNALRAMVWRLGATGDTSLIAEIAKTQTALKTIFNLLRGEADDRELLTVISSLDKTVKAFVAANDEVVKIEELKADIVANRTIKFAEEAGACAVMALERVPADIRAAGGVARMADPEVIVRIIESVTIPVMAKCRIGHFVEAQILEALGVDYVDESEVLTPADESYHVDKHSFTVPFVCGARDLGEALRRIGEGAAMIRTKGEAGTGNVVEAVRHMRAVQKGLKRLTTLRDDELMAASKELGAPFEVVKQVARTGMLPVPNFAAGGVATPADAALMVQLGAEAVFVGSGIFEVGLDLRPEDQRHEQLRMARAIVKAVTHANRPDILAEVSEGLPKPMRGVSMEAIPEDQQLAKRGW
jgi:pyridoxal 5'-phosphate synthase pdxS subunit